MQSHHLPHPQEPSAPPRAAHPREVWRPRSRVEVVELHATRTQAARVGATAGRAAAAEAEEVAEEAAEAAAEEEEELLMGCI